MLEIVQTFIRSCFTVLATQRDENSEHGPRSWQTRSALTWDGLAATARSRHRTRLLGVGLKERIDGAESVADAPAG
jgi:hypothetical protein